MDKDAIRMTAYALKDRMEQNGRPVYRIEIPERGQHPHASQMATLLFLLGAFGLIALVLSGVLTANMISALLAQQIREIGVLKAVAASAIQVTSLYLGVAALLGTLALAIGIPLRVLGGRGYAEFAAMILNFDIQSDAIPHSTFALQAAIGLLVPVVVALYPIYRGSRITVRQAMSDYGAEVSSFGKGGLDRLLSRVRGLPRPLILSLRNTFRRRARLVLTLATLAMGGAGLIVAMNVSASMTETVESKFSAARYDVLVRFNQPYPSKRIEQIINTASSIARVESWGGASAARVYADRTEGNRFNLMAPPAKTELMSTLPLVAGRWLRPDDRNALVVNQVLLAKEPDLKVGDELVLEIGEIKTTWQVVGVVQEIMTPPTAYANYESLAQATGQAGYAQNAVVVVRGRDATTVAAAARSLEWVLADAGFDVGTITKLADSRQVTEAHLELLATFLVIMSVLIVMVGGLGLASTMSINVLERTRELGVLRAIGATSLDIVYIVTAEGAIIGAVSWLLAVGLSWPLSSFVSTNFGMTFFYAPLEFAVSVPGFVLWLGIAVVFAGLAGFFPAWSATQLSVRQVLAYE